MNRADIVVMFFVAQVLALWGLWDIPSIDVNGQALLLAFLTLEGLFIAAWLLMAYVIAPSVVWAVDRVRNRNG